MANQNFPGNPYIDAAGDPHVSSDAYAIVKAIKALAFEVRTANLQRQAQFPMHEYGGMDEDTARLVLGFADETGKRLGL